MRALSLTLAVALLLLLPTGIVAEGPDDAKLEELWKTGSLWQVGDNIPKVEAARKEIVAAGDAGLAFIFTKLNSTDGLEYRCLEAVFKGFGAKALPGLFERLAHEDVKVRRNVAAMLGVRHRAESAFGVDPRRDPRVDWLVCDVIAYPPRTLALVRRWLEAGRAAK